MEIVAPIAAYLIASFFAARLLLDARPSRVPSLGGLVASTLLAVLWPLWAPFVAYLRLRARLEKPAYLQTIGELEELRQRHISVQSKVDDLLEQLGHLENEQDDDELLFQLDSETQKRTDTLSRFEQLFDRAQAQNVRIERWVNVEAPRPLSVAPEDWISGQSNNVSRVSRISIYISSDTEEGNDWDTRTALRRLRAHLLGEGSPTSRLSTDGVIYHSIRYRRRTPARSKSWEAVFTSSFRKSIKNVGADIESKVLAAIEDIIINPVEPRGSTVQPLKGNHKGLWRYRIGEFRLIYQPVTQHGELRLISLTHRSQAY